jgi:hypothetical protein
MNISFERTGGFAGMRVVVTVDTDSLSPADATALQKLVTASDFFNQSDARPTRVVPDGFQYTITIKDGVRQHTLHLGDGSIPDKLQPLVNDLATRARSQR